MPHGPRLDLRDEGAAVRSTSGHDSMASASRRLSKEEEEAIRRQLAELRQEHRDLDAAITAMVDSGGIDTIRIQRWKKRKLILKDRIAVLEDQLLPDIIA
jgi:hypothetical protein